MKIPGIFFRVNYENDVLYVGNHVDVHKGAGPPTHVDACGQMGGSQNEFSCGHNKWVTPIENYHQDFGRKTTFKRNM